LETDIRELEIGKEIMYSDGIYLTVFSIAGGISAESPPNNCNFNGARSSRFSLASGTPTPHHAKLPKAF
jgi:hypothetical protein